MKRGFLFLGPPYGIYQGNEEGTKVFEETHNVISSVTRQLYFLIGSGTSVTGSIGEIDWANGPYFLNWEVDLAVGTDYTITGRSQFYSLAYIKYGDRTGNVLDISEVRVSTENGSLFIGKYSFVIIPGITIANSIVDYDGNVYQSVTIGTQEWMAENLRTTHYNDGTLIENVTNETTWAGLTTGARTYYGNDSTTNAPVYGALYNWYAASSGKLCPTGWHVPTRDELSTLNTFLGSNAGLKLREVGTTYWNSDNGATNEYGFSARGAGYYGNGGSYLIGKSFDMWSSTERATDKAWSRTINFFYTSFPEQSASAQLLKLNGKSVRCLKD